MMVAADVSAAKPCTGSSLTTRVPIVLMIRQPPAAVPSEMAVAASSLISIGTTNSSITPALSSASVMTPIVFCASLLPWLRAMYPADSTCRRRKLSFMIRGRAPLNTLKMTTMTARPRRKPMIGEVTSGMSTLSRMPSRFHDSIPAAANDAPSNPPISAWLLELGIPARQVIRFQTMAPMRAAATTSWLSVPSSIRPAPMVAATAVPISAPTKLATALSAMAWSGRRARVLTLVAMALAVSWNPLM